MTFSGLENLVHCPHHMLHYTEITFRGCSQLNSYNIYFPESLVFYKFLDVQSF